MPRKHQATAIPCRRTRNTDQLLGISNESAVAQVSLIIVNTVFTWIPISSWAKSADKGSPLRTGIVDEPSGLIISIRTEGLYTGCRAKEVSFHKLASKTLITGSSLPIAKKQNKINVISPERQGV
jgi:hypothetical protein